LEALDIVVVPLHQDLVIGTLEIVSPLFHYLDNPEELPIESVVVLSSGRAFSKVEIYEEKNLTMAYF
jgi:hypothetical protein